MVSEVFLLPKCKDYMQPTDLAAKIITRIIKDGSSTYDKLEARAVALGINMNTFQAAMVIVHRSKLIEQSVKYGVIQYKVAVKKEVKPGPQRPSYYPDMDETNDGSGIEADFSYLFLSPEEMDKYRAEAAGRTYIPKKRYARK